MTETAKTFTFVGVGIAAVVVALLTRPSPATLDLDELVGDVLGKQFASVSDANRLRIVRVDEETATIDTFEVAEQGGLWTLPSKEGYPADASRQMATAVTSLMDRQILNVEDASPADRGEFGVIDPLQAEVGQKGIGTRVTVWNAQNEPLVDWIIGKEVPGAPEQRYVREQVRDLVYVVEIDPARLSTKFEDWIEKDLLKLNRRDLKQVQIKDYSAVMDRVLNPLTGEIRVSQIGLDSRAEMSFAYNDADSKWSPLRLREMDRQPDGSGEFVDVTLAEDQELDDKVLDDLSNALDDLTIVDVARKPDGLSADLKAGDEFLNNPDARQSLEIRGFAQDPRPGREQEIISSDGEVVVTMKDGTEYVLRFGDLTQVTSGDQADEKDTAKGDAPSGEDGVHRYLFVMARFNEAAVEKPKLEELPELPPDATSEGEASVAGEDQSEDEAEADAGGVEEGEDQDNAVAAGDSAASNDSTSSSEPASTGESASADGAAQESTSDQQQTDEAEDTASELDALIAERKRIEAENQRKLDEYQETLKKGRENVEQLNARFGDWYFVVSDDVFQKIRLGLDDVIKKKEPAEDGDAGAANSTGESVSAGESASADGDQATSNFGAPGTPIPGLPEIPDADDE